MTDRDKAPWTLAEFQRLYPALSRKVLKPLMDICNKALEHGLTRTEVADTFTELHRLHPGELPASAIVDALAARAHPMSCAEHAEAATAADLDVSGLAGVAPDVVSLAYANPPNSPSKEN